jgi:hypothetical protein
MQACWARGTWGMVLATAWLVGCGPFVLPEDGSGGESEGSTTGPPNTTVPPGTTAPPFPGTTSVGPSTEGNDSTTSGVPETDSLSFLDGHNDGSAGNECDFWLQDCPRGEKCMPWANDGGSAWNALRCSPIAEDPAAPGEPCLVEGSGVSGIDTCELGAMCWDVDPDTLEGTCVAFCVGDEANPMCEDPNSTCSIPSDGVLALCFPRCDPLQQDCTAGNACYPTNDSFQCIPDVSGDMGAAGDACEFINVCDPGNFCASAELVPDCAGMVGCCTPFCNLDQEPLPCLAGQECVPWYERVMAPPGFESLGACVLPS